MASAVRTSRRPCSTNARREPRLFHRQRSGKEIPCHTARGLATVGASGWIALTHDQRIRYKANERDAVMRNGVAMIVLIGKASYSVLAQSFVSSIERIEAFVERNRPPFIAKLFRPSAGELAADGNAPGRIELWLSEAEWRAYRGGR